MLLHTFQTPGLSINSYFLGDLSSKRAVVIDPTRNIASYVQFAKDNNLEITDIVETHVHADYISGAKELKSFLDNKPTIHCSALGGNEWLPTYADVKVNDGYEMQLGTVHLKALHTPGHTPEHLIWLCYDDSRSSEIPCLAFTGDLLFVGSVGRPDLLGREAAEILTKQLYHSLFTTLAELPDFLEIFPAHGAGSLCGKGLSARPSTTLGYERLFNPALKKQPFDEWKKNIQKDIPSPPKSFQRMKQTNAKGVNLSSQQHLSNIKPEMIIDSRSPEEYSKGHIKDSINIPLGSAFCNWAGSVIISDIPLGVVAETAAEMNETINGLKLIGFDQIVLEIIWNEELVRKDFDIAKLPLNDVQSLATKLNTNAADVYVLDVRTDPEWNAGHINGAHHYELAHITQNIDKIPKDACVSVVCGGGFRASIVASLLKKHGYKKVENIRGGMAAWHKAKLPTSTDGI